MPRAALHTSGDPGEEGSDARFVLVGDTRGRAPPGRAMSLTEDPTTTAVLAIAAVLIGLSKGGVAGGLGPVVTILLALVTTPSRAIGLLLPLLIVGDAVAVVMHRGRWDGRLLRSLLPGAAVGVVAATVFLGAVDDRAIEIALGALSALFVLSRLRPHRTEDGPLAPTPWLARVAGASSGVTSTIAHAGGPPLAIYLLATATPPRTYVATSAVFFAMVNLLKVPGYVATGLLDTSAVPLLLFGMLIVPGTLAGRWLVDRIDHVVFERLILVLLAGGAVVLLLG